MIDESQLRVGTRVRWVTRGGVVLVGRISEIAEPHQMPSARALYMTRPRRTRTYVIDVHDGKQSRPRIPPVETLLRTGEVL